MSLDLYHSLIEGHKKYKNSDFPQNKSLHERLAKGQKPKDPCLLTSAEPGDLFVIRNAGNMVPTINVAGCSELASLEFAVCALKTPHLIVCGHSECGAMKACLSPETVQGFDHLPGWIENGMKGLNDHVGGASNLDKAIEMNVLHQIKVLRELEFIQSREDAGELSLHGWIYDIASGSINELEID
jgi:carbonic anhydrase